MKGFSLPSSPLRGEDREPAPYLIRGGGEVKAGEDKGEGVKDRIPAPYPRDISSKKISSKLPMDIAPLKELASKKDPESVKKTIDIHGKGEISTRTVIEMEARNNPALKAGLSREISEALSSDDTNRKALAIQSAIRLKQFDEPYRGKIRQLIKDKDPEVASRALAFCGWSRDTDAFENVLDILKESRSEKLNISGLACMSVIGKGRETELSQVMAEKLASKSPNVRRACLSALFHLKGCLKDKEVKARVAEISAGDSFSIDTAKGERYPLRDLAKELLKLHESK